MKSCYRKTDNTIEVSASNGAPSLLFNKLKIHYGNDEKALKKYSQIKDIDYKYKDINGEPNLILNTGYEQLDNLLVALQTSGIGISEVKSFIGENELKNGNKITTIGLASLTKKIIKFTKGDIEGLSEEAIHLARKTVEHLKSYQNALGMIDTTQEFKDFYEQYKEVYKSKGVTNADELARKEVLDKIVATKFLNQSKPNNMSSTFWGSIRSFVKSIMNKFSKPNLENLVDSIIEDIQKQDSFDFAGLQQEDMYKLDTKEYEGVNLSKYTPALESHIDKLQARIEKLERLGERSSKTKRELDKLENDLLIFRNDLSVVNRINTARKKIKRNIKRLDSISQFKGFSGNEVARVLRTLQDDYNLYLSLFEDIKSLGIKDKNLKKEVRKAVSDLKEFELEYKKVRVEVLKRFMFPFAKINTAKYKDMSSEELDDLIKEAELLSNTDRWLQSMADAKDEFLKIMDQIIKKADNLVRKKSIQEINKMFKLWDNVENKKDLSRFYHTVTLPDGTTVLGRHFKSDINTEQFEINMQEIIKEGRNKFGISLDYKIRKEQFKPQTDEGLAFAKTIDSFHVINSKKELVTYNSLLANNKGNVRKTNEEAIKLIKIEYNKYVGPWFKENTITHPDLIKKVGEKFVDIVDDLLLADAAKYKKPIKEAFMKHAFIKGEMTTGQATEIIRQTLDEIVGKVPGFVKEDIISATYSFDAWLEYNTSHYRDETGTLQVAYKFDLSMPDPTIYRSSLEDLTTNDLKFLAYINKIKQEKNKKLPGFHQDYMSPQMNQGTQERIENGDLAGVFQSIKESFQVNADDTDLGQLDENGQQVKEIPIFFNNKLDYKDMSRDIPTVMANFIVMANHNIEMNIAIDSIQLMQEQNQDRKVYKTVGGKRKYVSGDTNVTRAEDQINMTIYKQQKLPETIFGKSIVRVSDTIQKWVSLDGLGGNIFSGVANIFTSAATLMQERLVSKFGKGLDSKSWAKARSIYTKYGVGSITDYEQEVTTNKFKIMSREMGIEDNLVAKLANNDAAKSRIGRMIKSLPFAPNSIGEHAIQHFFGLAMMANVKLTKKDGSTIDLIDAFFESIIDGEVIWGDYTLNDKPFKLIDAQNIGRNINKENQRLFGIYNDIDKSAIQQYVLGRFVMQFRKFIVPGFNRRWQGQEFDFQSGREVEGMYRSYGRFLSDIWERCQGQRHQLLSTTKEEWKRWQTEDPEGFNNLIRSHVEVANIIAALGFGAFLSAIVDGEDDDEPLLAFAAYQMNRHYSEMSFFTNPKSFFEITKSPLAAVNQLETVMNMTKTFDVFGYVFEDDPLLREYKDGTGETYFGRNGVKLVPGVKQYLKLTDIQKQFDFTK